MKLNIGKTTKLTPTPRNAREVFPGRPATIHGFLVFKALGIPGGPGGRDGWLVLVNRGEEYPEQYVTAMIYGDDEEWNLGHYHYSFEDALKDFGVRARLNAGF